MLTAAIIGCGNIAGGYDDYCSRPNILTHAGAYASCADMVQLLAACDPSEEVRRRFLHTRPGVQGYEDSATMLAAVRPNIVSICSPTALHETHLVQAISYGARAIICEKPLSENANTAKTMVKLCREHGALLCVPYLRRWAPHFVTLGHEIAAARHGKLQAATVVYTKGIRHNASHFMDLLYTWCGDWHTPVIFAGKPWGSHDMSADFAVTFGNVRTLFLHLRAECYEASEMQLFFEKGRLDVLRGGREFRRQGIVQHPTLQGANMLANSFETEEWTEDRNMLYMLRNVLDAISGTRPLAARPEEAVRVLELCDDLVTALEEHIYD